MQESVDYTIREASAGDVNALALIGAATFLETFAGILDGDAIIAHCAKAHGAAAYRSFFDNGGRAWLAEVAPGGAPVGFALITKPDLPAAEAGDVELKRIYVLSRFHGTGMGAALMDIVVGATLQFDRLLLGVYAGNQRAQAFYRKNGFEQIATRRFDVGGKAYDDIVFARRIAA